MEEREFYKEMHPDLFSDSKIVKKGKLTEEFFSYYLESLTNQNKEKEFENYCRKILGSTVCPNLLSQTGPIGGGDSKVDSETFPVSEVIAESWLIGYGDLAHKERWAFAISAKKDWKPKLKSDVKKIIGTNTDDGRGYAKIFFVTNQFVSDKKRSEAEDDLRKEYEIDIRIFDRTWLLKNTFRDNNQRLAIETFHMSEDLLDVVEEGPKDLERKRRLKEIDAELSNVENLKWARIVKLSEESVGIMRSLEVDKVKVVGALERNLRFSKKYGHSQDYINSLYEFCWTILWWYEDRDMFYEKYLEIEAIYKQQPENYALLKKLSALWVALSLSNLANKKTSDNIKNHTNLIKSSFERFIQDNNNPNRSLLARYDYQIFRMYDFKLKHDCKSCNDIVNECLRILEKVRYNNDIDLYLLKGALGLSILKKALNYDELFEKLIVLLGEQSHNMEVSQLLINRGDDYLDSDVYNAIEYYSRALSMLYQEESKIDLIKTLLKLGWAFEKIGLVWGARSYYVRAFTNSLKLYFEEGTVIPELFLSMRPLRELELRLGRLNYALRMNELEQKGLKLYPYEINEDEESERYRNYDLRLAIYLLNLPASIIDEVDTLPDYLSGVGLYASSIAMKYKLGYYDEVCLEKLKTKDDFDKHMQKLFNHPVSKEFQNILNSENCSEVVTLKTKIIGCDVFIRCGRGRIEQEFGSSLLAMLENIFATAVVDKIIAMTDSMVIEIHKKDGDSFNIDLCHNENTVNVMIINIDELIEFKNEKIVFERMNSIIGICTAQIVLLEENFQKFKKLCEKDEVWFRCFSHSSTLGTFLTYEDDFSLVDNNRRKYVNRHTFNIIGT